MEFLYISIIIIHGFFHFLGFLKAFNLVAFNHLNLKISKPAGIAFLVDFVIFGFLILMYAYHNTNWWVYGIIGTLISQLLLIAHWKTAKYGTIGNIIIIWPCLLAFATHFLLKK
jgi:hypothetical protein